MNTKQSALWLGALKSAVGAACGVILANFVDTPQAVLSWPWFKHILIATGFVVLVTEARFWNQWASSGTVVPMEAALKTAADATAKAGVAITDAQSVQKVTEIPVKPN
jgi:hypothetical protein